jgi:pyruvate dehydrogenase E2 component (dihydrolipoamide acetyltransferase)
MPSLGADMDAGKIVEWRVGPGDEVHRGDIVALVETDKAEIEVEIYDDGTIEEILVPVGVKVDVGTPLARVRVVGELEAAVRLPVPPPAPTRAEAVPALAPPRGAPSREAAAGRASPLARRRASELGLDIAAIAGTGPRGAVTVDDVERAAAAAPAPETRQQAMRRRIGQLMARSKREIPHYYLATTVDATPLLEWLAETNAARSVTERILPAAVLIRAVASAVREVPEMNGFFENGAFVASDAVHAGVAISLRGGGLIAPAIHDVQDLAVGDIMAALRDLVGRTRGGRLKASEMSDPTITVSNLGEQGVESVYAVIYPPQVALVGFGAILERPWVVGRRVEPRSVVRATLAADHRVSDGHRGARFLAAIDRLLQEPEKL